LHAAIYAALTADAALKALVGDPARVYDDVPEGTPFPYVTLGEISTLDWSTASEIAFEHRLTLHIWSRYGGRKEIRDITAAIHDVLHDADLALAGHRLVSLFFQASDVFRDPDGATVHGLARYRARTAPI
jgi:hypothetical protein